MIVIFGLKTPLSDSLQAKDKKMLGLSSAIALHTESEQLEHQMSPVCCPDDENPPLLRSKTTTPETMLQSMGQALLVWDKDTEEFFYSIFTDLFDFIAPGAVSVSKRELEDIVDAAGERCEEAGELQRYRSVPPPPPPHCPPHPTHTPPHPPPLHPPILPHTPLLHST
jgi:hypothetical protein